MYLYNNHKVIQLMKRVKINESSRYNHMHTLIIHITLIHTCNTLHAFLPILVSKKVYPERGFSRISTSHVFLSGRS